METRGKKAVKRFTVLAVALAVIFCGALTVSDTASAKTKKMIIKSVSDTTLECYKAVLTTDYLDDPVWVGYIGTGKCKKLKMSDKVVFKLMDFNTQKSYKVTREEFENVMQIMPCYREDTEGKVCYYGLSCQVKLKNNKVVKIVQLNQ